MKKRLPIGISDFGNLISNNHYFVDKSLLIKEVLDSGAAVTLIPRPRRFGKTLNLSMIKYFFEKTTKSNKKLFDNLAISKQPEYMKHQGKHPIIYLTFKDIKADNWDKCYKHMIKIIRNEFERHSYILNKDNILSDFETKEVKEIISLTANQPTYETSLLNLSTYLYRYHKQKPLILIDEYDAPIHAGFIHDYYQQIVNFMKTFLSGGLKDNTNLEFSVVTGILKVAKESIFSDMNNLEVCSILDELYSDKFGLLENEIKELLKYYELDSNIEQITKWYNGYTFWQHTIYNPWSIINFAKSKGVFQPYWINTSQNAIIKDFIRKSGQTTKKEIEQLMLGECVLKPIYKNVVLSEAFSGNIALWSFLLFSGYLTYKKTNLIGRTLHADLIIPNQEVLYFFETTISNWFNQGTRNQNYNEMLETLISGDIKTFSKIFKDFVLNSFSYFDVSGKEPEKFYHAFVLGLLVGLSKTHRIKSNRESGYGRYDVMVIPNDKDKPGIVIEFKKIDKEDEQSLDDSAKNALLQIEEKKYEQELKELGVKKVLKLAIVFDGKKVLVKN